MTTFSLKIIALVTMIIDHSAMLVSRLFGNPCIYTLMRIVGRIAFPIFAFLIAEGCRHTKNIQRYIGRILLFALISEIPFDFKRGAETGNWVLLEFGHQNVFFTLFFGVLSVYLYNEIEKRFPYRWQVKLLTAIELLCCALLAQLLSTDYGAKGVFIVFLIYISRIMFTVKEHLRPVLAVILAIFILYMPSARMGAPMFAGAMTSILPIYLYNGKKGPSLKWFFYFAYPIHLAIIGGIFYLLAI